MIDLLIAYQPRCPLGGIRAFHPPEKPIADLSQQLGGEVRSVELFITQSSHPLSCRADLTAGDTRVLRLAFAKLGSQCRLVAELVEDLQAELAD